jgi:hypothetical protein
MERRDFIRVVGVAAGGLPPEKWSSLKYEY